MSQDTKIDCLVLLLSKKVINEFGISTLLTRHQKIWYSSLAVELFSAWFVIKFTKNSFASKKIDDFLYFSTSFLLFMKISSGTKKNYEGFPCNGALSEINKLRRVPALDS